MKMRVLVSGKVSTKQNTIRGITCQHIIIAYLTRQSSASPCPPPTPGPTNIRSQITNYIPMEANRYEKATTRYLVKLTCVISEEKKQLSFHTYLGIDRQITHIANSIISPKTSINSFIS
jgi:hypothetical protein